MVLFRPAISFAFDALVLGEVFARERGSVAGIRYKIEPQFFGSHAATGHGLKFVGVPAKQQAIIERVRASGSPYDKF